MNEVNLRKLAVDINSAPTMMVMTVWKEVICKSATYYPREGWQRGHIRYYRGPCQPHSSLNYLTLNEFEERIAIDKAFKEKWLEKQIGRYKNVELLE